MQVKMSPGKSAIVLLILFGSTQTSQDLRRYASYRDDDRSMMTTMSRTRNGDAILSCDRSGTRCALDENHSRIMERKPDSRRHELDSRRNHFAVRSGDRTFRKHDDIKHGTRYRSSDRERVFNDRRVLNDDRNMIQNVDTQARSERSRERLKEDATRMSDGRTRNGIDAERVLQDRRIDQRMNGMDRRTIPENSERRMRDRTSSRNSLSEKYATIRDSYRKPFRDNQQQISRKNTRSTDVSLGYSTDDARRSETPDIRENRDAQRTLNRYSSALGRSNKDADTGASSVDSLRIKNINAERTSAFESRNPRDIVHFRNNAHRNDDTITNEREVRVRDSSPSSDDSGMVRGRRYIDIERHDTRTSTLESKARRDIHISRNNGERRDASITSEREVRIRVSSPDKIHEQMNRQLFSRTRFTRESNDVLLQTERRDTLEKSRRFRDSDVNHRRSAWSSRRDQSDDIRILENSVNLQRTSPERRVRQQYELIPSTVQTNSHSRDETSDQERSFVGNNRNRSSRDSREREISERRSMSALRRDLREDIRSSKNSENVQRTLMLSLERRVREVIPSTVQSYSRGKADRSLEGTSFIENHGIRSSGDSLQADISQRRTISSLRREYIRSFKNSENVQRTSRFSLERKIRELIPSTVQSYFRGKDDRSLQETSFNDNNIIRSSRNFREREINERRSMSSLRRDLHENIHSENLQKTSKLSLERRIRAVIPSTFQSYSRGKDDRSPQETSFIENNRIRSSRNSLETDIRQRRSILSSRRQDIRSFRNSENVQRTSRLSLERRIREVIPSTVQSYSRGKDDRSHQDTASIENNRIRSSRNSREADNSHRLYTLSSTMNLRKDIRYSKNSEDVQITSRLSLERRVREMIPSTVQSYSRDKDSRSNQDDSFVRKMEETKDGRMIRFTDRMIGTKAHAQNRFLKERTIIEPPEMGHSEQNKFTLAWLNTLQIILGVYLIGEMFGVSKKSQKGFFQIPQLGLKVRREKVN